MSAPSPTPGLLEPDRHATSRTSSGEGVPDLCAVLEPEFSRNRHYDLYGTPEGRALWAFRRIVHGLIADLARVGPEQPLHISAAPGGQVWIELYIPRFRATRRSCLTLEQLEALKSHPVIGPRLTSRQP